MLRNLELDATVALEGLECVQKRVTQQRRRIYR